MSAKKNSQQSNQPRSSTPAPAAAPSAAAMATPTEDVTPWIESSDPRKRMIGKIALVVIWVYVAALCLLAIDQWFNLGIFGPKIPQVP